MFIFHPKKKLQSSANVASTYSTPTSFQLLLHSFFTSQLCSYFLNFPELFMVRPANTDWVDVCREGARGSISAALMLFTPAQVDQCWLKALKEGTGREDATGSALII